MVDLTWLIINIILGVGTLIALGAMVYGLVTLGDEGVVPLVCDFIGLLVIAGLGLVNNFPFDMAYHSYRPVSGVVSSINSRLVDSGNSSTETKYVVTFQGSAQPYGCTDTRCAAVKKGDHLQLMCERTWQYASVSGYDCNYDSVGV